MAPRSGSWRPPMICIGAGFLAELLILLAWFRFAGSSGAPAGLSMALWIWPAAWVVVTTLGMALTRMANRPSTAVSMLADLTAQACLVAAPVVVALYALLTMIIAWR